MRFAPQTIPATGGGVVLERPLRARALSRAKKNEIVLRASAV